MSDLMIEARELKKQYGPVDALRDVTFSVHRGEVVGFLGPNGAGKTTTMKILTCFIAPSDGSAQVHGCDVFEDPIGVRRAIGYLPESTPLYTDMITLEYLEFVAKMRGFKGEEARRRIRKAVEQTGLGDVIAKEIRALSKGYRQRVGLAQALVHEPPILILDEPMSGLDPNQAVEIRDLIKEIGKERTVILSTHNLAEVQVTCDRVLIIAKGRVVADDTAEGLRVRTGRARYTVSVLEQADGRKLSGDEVRAQLAKIDGVEKVQVHEVADGELGFDVIPAGNQDLRPELFRAAVAGGFTLVGLSQAGENLEDVFRQLTAGRAGDSAVPEITPKQGKGPSDGPGTGSGQDSHGTADDAGASADDEEPAAKQASA